MSLKWNTDYIAHEGGYGADRKYSNLKYIIIHYTGNEKDTALNNAKYFHNNKVLAGANCFIDGEGVVYKSTPISSRTYSVGVLHNKKYAKYWGIATDYNSINIEIACDKGNYESTDKAIEYAIELTRFYMKKYNIPASHVLRHKDVCGKNCPAYFWDDKKWEKEFKSKLDGEIKPAYAKWKHDSKGWWYEYDDGSYPKNEWKIINNKWYHFDKYGYMEESKWIGDYYVGNDGAMLSNCVTPDGYTVDSTGKWDGKPKKATGSYFYASYTGNSGRIDEVLRAVGVPEKYRGSWTKRKAVAKANGISSYTGTANQNLKLIALAKKGTLKRV